ncbi:beta-mannosidase [Paenibacillus arenilitoris]|uniref:Beta-mannosidase n=1 Tax=Paenibacillus arenilitoris TaxID=2772299 RepID=A0A927H4J4_9BACL|nr:glycoside hydrolase family 2 protein [Paenibacillus arenilitoris]MBD2867452.1 glycoside hydrolase family 2 protein [Paenibacillus arenilitoris]
MGENKQVLGNWKFKACKDEKWMDAVVPGCVHTDLLRCGTIADPFRATNEHDLQWIDKLDWEYETRFDADGGMLASSNLQLVFDGLDTYADVYLNGKHVLSADNMFRTWKADVLGIVTEKDNVLTVRFRSPVSEDLPKIKKLGYNLPASNDQSELGGLGEDKISVFARKAPYHYGWDWGPRFVTSGIWREARLEGWSDAKVSDVFVRQDRVTVEEAALTVGVTIEADRDFDSVVRLSAEGHCWEQAVSLKRGTNVVQIPATIIGPKLWWSRGLGEAYLYVIKAELYRGAEMVAAGSARTGLRSVRLVRDKDAAGASFYFELNGVPVFAKGANHIPNDSFLTEVTEERYRHEIATAAESNMNMLRVWGGGIYEQPAFYELCDEYGILIWQDFMFACSMYPGDEAFLSNVRAEAEENVKRLRNHPSIVLWCGNNEIDSAWSEYEENGGWGWKKNYTAEQRKKIWADYEAVFHRILPEVVDACAPGMAYWPSSPLVSLTGDRSQHAHPLSSEGDIHYWGVWHSVEPFENYNVKIGRFMSEYGFQSFPEYDTVMTFATESDLALDSKVMRAHQKNGDGNRLIKEYMDIYMSEPKDFPSFLYMSQVLQAEAMKIAIEAHRRKMPYCMGTLYWQMNDCWPVASWSGMDYYGKWKAMQYYAMNSFKDTMVSFDRTDGGRVEAHVVRDELSALSGELRVVLHDFAGAELKREVASVSVEGNSSSVVFSFDEREWLNGRDAGSVVLHAELWADGLLVDGKAFYFVKAKELALGASEIRIEEAEGSGGTKFTLKSDALAKQVWLTAEEPGIFSDNFFDLIPGVEKTIEFRRREAGEALSKPASPGGIRVRSMIDFLLERTMEG